MAAGTMARTAWPDPTSDAAKLAYYTQRDGPCRLELFDLQGRLVKTLADGNSTAGGHSTVWDGRDEDGRPVPYGTYYCRLTAGSSLATSLLTVVR